MGFYFGTTPTLFEYPYGWHRFGSNTYPLNANWGNMILQDGPIRSYNVLFVDAHVERRAHGDLDRDDPDRRYVITQPPEDHTVLY